jgi:hypothetical protein
MAKRSAEGFLSFDWAADSRSLLYSSGHRLWRVSLAGGKPEKLLFAQDVWNRWRWRAAGIDSPAPKCAIPAALALGRTPQAWENWIALIPNRKKEFLRYFSRLNSPDARARNLGKALVVLSGQTGRFMARAWKNGS